MMKSGIGNSDFTFSVRKFFSTVGLLRFEKLVVLDLFGGNFSNEVIQHSVDGIYGSSRF